MKTKATVLIVCMGLLCPFAFCEDTIKLDKVQDFDIQYRLDNPKLKGSLFIDDTLSAQNQINEQQKSDLEDIENLWNATVSNNPMIAFCLKKLATPASERRIHSSIMAKSMSALISGAALLPSFLGLNYGIQSGTYAAGKLANNLINKKNTDKLENPAITDTEAIELASLVEELQDEIIVNYYKYKGALLKLKKCREQLLLYNKNYSAALQGKSSLDIALTSSQWEDELIEEYEIKEDVKKYYLALMRLAGKQTVNDLNLAQFDLTFQNVNSEDLNFEKRKLDVSLENAKGAAK